MQTTNKTKRTRRKLTYKTTHKTKLADTQHMIETTNSNRRQQQTKQPAHTTQHTNTQTRHTHTTTINKHNTTQPKQNTNGYKTNHTKHKQ